MKIDRLVGIVITLLDRERIGARELADLFEVSPRTIYRDIEAINMAGIPVCSISGVGGGFEIMPAYKIDKNVFSAADLSAILMGLSTLSGMVRGDELVNARAKVRSLIPAGRAKDIEEKADRICMDASPWLGNQNIQPYLLMIQAALEEHRRLFFAYIAHHGNRTMRTVEPYRLVLKGGCWYLYGYCLNRRDCRLFRLSRMTDLRIMPETFIPGDCQKPILDFTEILETMQKEIRIRVHSSVLDRVLAFCSYDRFTPDGDAHYIVDFPFIENEYYYDVLLGFGDKCECLAPAHIRAKMKQKIRDMAAIYGD